MQQLSGPFNDHERYFNKLSGACQQLFEQPLRLILGRITFRQKDNRLIGWSIEDLELNFKGTGDLLKVSEYAHVKDKKWYITRFSYHFEPKSNGKLIRYRVDLDRVSLHGNPDESFSDINHLCYPENIALRIDLFNLLVGIYVARTYITSEEYPFDNQFAVRYNKVILTSGGN